MINEAEFYLSDQREFVVGESWFAPQIALSAFGAAGTVTSPTAVVIRQSDGEVVTTAFWPSGSGTVDANYVTWSAFTMATVGDYELRLSALVNSRTKTYVQRVRVYE